MDTSRTRSPAAANNEAASPEPEDDRIARHVLDLKLSGAEGEQRRTTSQLCCVHLYCTCTPPLLLLNISDYVQISFHAHLKCIAFTVHCFVNAALQRQEVCNLVFIYSLNLHLLF